MDKQTITDIGGDLLNKIVDGVTDSVKNAVSGKVQEVASGFIGQNNDTSSSREVEDVEHIEIETINISEPDYWDGDKYEVELRNKLNSISKNVASGNPTEAISALNSLVSIVGDVAKFTEVQKTKRRGIDAQRDVIVSCIQSQEKIILDYLEKSFDERKENFAKLFAVIDDAVAKNNMEQLAMGLDSINKLAASSPFKALTCMESTQKALLDKKHIWDF